MVESGADVVERETAAIAGFAQRGRILEVEADLGVGKVRIVTADPAADFTACFGVAPPAALCRTSHFQERQQDRGALTIHQDIIMEMAHVR